MTSTDRPNRILRADDQVEIQFARYHTHVTGENPHDPRFKKDLEQGVLEMKWYDATDICVRGCWGKVHYGWDHNAYYGAWARVCQERTGFHRCRFISEVVPLELAGQAVTFAGAVAFDIRNDRSANVILNVHGSRTESTCIGVDLAREYVRPEYDFHVTFNPIYLGLPDGTVLDGYEFMSGIARIKVFPSLLRYGERMIFEFVSPIGFDEFTSGLTIGLLDSTTADIPALQRANGVTDAELHRRRDRLRQGTAKALAKKQDIVAKLSARPSVQVDCTQQRTGFDRGEKRVTMYPSWIGIGTPPDNAKVYAAKLNGLLGSFDLFRYQGHIDHYDYVTGQFSMSDSDRQEWQIISGTAKEVMFSAGPHHAFLTKLRSVAECDLVGTVANGIAEMTWERITDNYVQYLNEAKRICPSFAILQMPYELDNASDTEISKDIHYRFFQCCYRAVHTVNAGSPPGGPLRLVGPSINTFNTGRWLGWMDGFLRRYAEDHDPRKRLDGLTYHCYCFPGAIPKSPVGQHARILAMLTAHGLDTQLPIIIDEAGLAEFSVLDEYIDLIQFSRKQLASACWLLAIQHWYMQESDSFHPITGDGWHFGSLCLGKQGALTHRAKAMLLRSRLDDRLLSSQAQPQTAEEGYGLYSMATAGQGRVSVLLWNCSPGTFLDGLLPVRYPSTEVVISGLPESMRGRPAKLTTYRLDMEHSNEERVLSSAACQKLQKIDRQRYILDLSQEEVALLDHIDRSTTTVEVAQDGTFHATVDVEEHGIYLLVLEAH